MAKALEQGCDCIVTCGGIQSNHSRTTALAARQPGLDTHLILRWPGEMVFVKFLLPLSDCCSLSQNPESVGTEGNILLDRLAGAKIVLVPDVENCDRIVDGRKEKGLETLTLDYAAKLKFAILKCLTNYYVF